MTNKQPLLLLMFVLFLPFSVLAQLPDWPDLYDTSIVPELNIQVRGTDWGVILADETFDIEVPALFWAEQDGLESAILVSIRRKSATPINDKVSFKIDINEYEGDDPRATKLWHGVKKLSLENGDDVDMVAEGIAWAMHKVAAEHGIYPVGHVPGKANFVTLTVNLSSGCELEPCSPFELGHITETLEPMAYLSVEQPDKTFLKNRSLWVSEETWLYKQDEPALPPEVKEAGCFDERPNSPTFDALQCAPFIAGKEGGSRKKKGGGEQEPEACDMALVDALVEMNILLTQGAVGAFSTNRDDTFGNEHNFYVVDHSAAGDCESLPDPYVTPRQKRFHFPWDLDASLTKVDRSIYGDLQGKGAKLKLNQTGYQNLLLTNYPNLGLWWRTKYNQDLLTMSDQAFLDTLFQVLDEIELVAGAALEADPNSKVSNVSTHNQRIKDFLQERASLVRAQICQDEPDLAGCTQ